MGAEAGAPLMLVGDPLLEVDGARVLAGLRGSLAWVQASQEEINDLNVFPVPDGDTGSNMYLTMRSAVEDAQAAADPASAASVLASAAHGSLMGARGNSGVILSQIFRGLAQGAADGRALDATTLARCLAEARTVAYKAVMKPTEGTILTVVREAADAAARAAEDGADVTGVLRAAVAASRRAVEQTTNQLAALREAGVVDAGGHGFAVILAGFTQAIGDPEAVAPPTSATDAAAAPGAAAGAGARRGAAAVEMREEGWGYCTEFLIHGPGLAPESLRHELGGLGESALVVGDEDLVRVHIHTSDPAPLIAAAARSGRLSKLKVEDMSEQHHEVLARAGAGEPAAPPAAERKALGVVSVAPGSGFRAILAGLGADAVVEGGQTMNPSIEDLATAVAAAGAESVILLPNNRNVILTAQQVDAVVEDVAVRVVPTRNLPQGISALLAADPQAPLDVNVERMVAAIADVHALEVTRAVRDSSVNGIEISVGDVLAILDDEIIEVGTDETEVIETVLRSSATPELVTVYRGEAVGEADATRLVDRLRAQFTGVEFELHDGGQDHYSYVLSLE